MVKDLEGEGWKFSDGTLLLGGDNVNGKIYELNPRLMKDALRIISESDSVKRLTSLERISFGRGTHIPSDIMDGMSLLGGQKIDLYFDGNRIDDRAFMNCQNIKEITVCNQKSNYGIPKNCFANSSVESVHVIGDVTFKERAFRKCSNLRSLVMDDGDAEYNKPCNEVIVGEQAFEGTSLESVDFPNKACIDVSSEFVKPDDLPRSNKGSSMAVKPHVNRANEVEQSINLDSFTKTDLASEDDGLKY